MATLAQLQEALGNPNVRKMLDLISNTEGTTKNGYNTAFGGGRFDNLSAHPNVRSSFTQTDGKSNFTTAAGRYQFLKGTWDGLSKQYGFRDFSPQAQDMGAIALLAQNGALKDAMNGDFQSAIQKSGKTWASLPSSQYAQNKKSWDYVNKNLGQDAQAYKPETISAKDMQNIMKNQQYSPEILSAEDMKSITSPTPQQNKYVPDIISADQMSQLVPQIKQV